MSLNTKRIVVFILGVSLCVALIMVAELETRKGLNLVEWSINHPYWVIAFYMGLLTLVVIAVFGIFFLHRVAGPVYRFRKTIMRLNDGEIPPIISLREGDFFSETAGDLNRLIRRTKFEWEKDKTLKQKVQQILAAGSSHPCYQDAKTLKAVLDEEWRETT